VNTPRPPAPQPRRRPPGTPTRPVPRPRPVTGDRGAAPANRWLPAIAAAGVLGVVIIAGLSGGGRGDASAPPSVPSVAVDTASTAASVVTQPNVAADPTATTIVKSTIAAPVFNGSYGEDVEKVQQRLTDLGFAPGPVDGFFGSGTQQAVWAYKKLVKDLTWRDLDNSGSASAVTPELWLEMQDPIVFQPRRPQGAGTTHVEIYLPQQVLMVFTDDKPTLIAHISTGVLDEAGQPKEFCETATIDTDVFGEKLAEPVEKAICAEAKTPGGIFRFGRREEGNHVSPLGGMLNPVYFNYGIAVHGAHNVPRTPASHGCVRVNNQIAAFFPSLVSKGDRVFVWGHDGKEPEYYSKAESLPSFNRPDPNATTTTSSTTTTAPATTVAAPATTKPPTATTKPVPATTAVPTTVPNTTTTAAVTTTTIGA
jgi:L,D-transpeptidase catalytic domain/Putative peptidoglycan binding domain